MGTAKAMLETGILPDFIFINGAEDVTGAAPVEFTITLACRCVNAFCSSTTRW
jgi:glutamate synthase domain-containing protein 2